MIELFKRILLIAVLQLFTVQLTVAQDTIALKKLPTVDVKELVKDRLILSDVSHSSPRYVLSISKMEDMGVRDVGEALKFIPGIQIRDYGGIGGIKTVSYRSLTGSYTNLTLDGATMANTQSSVLNLTQFDIFSLKRISFSTGQPKEDHLMPSMYLSVNQINLDSYLSFPDSFQVGFYQNVTTINSFLTGMNLSAPLGKYFSGGFQLLSRYGSGIYPYKYELTGSENDFDRINSKLFAILGRAALNYHKGKTKLSLVSNYQFNNQQLPGAIILYNPSHDQELLEKNQTTTFTYEWKGDKWKLNSTLQYRSLISRYYDPEYLNLQGFIESNYDQRISSAGLILNRYLKSSDLRIFAGVDFIHSTLKSDEFSGSPARQSAVFLLGAVKWIGRFKLEGNLASQLVFDKSVVQDSIHYLSYFKPSPYIAVSVLPIKDSRLRIRSFYKHTYRVPSLNDLYYNFIGNTELEPEEAHVFNLGVSHAWEKNKHKLEWTIDPYLSLNSNKILAIPTKDIFNWSMQNVGKSRSIGIDVSINYGLELTNGSLVLGTNHNLNSTVNLSNENSPSYGHQLPYTPWYSSSASVAYNFKSWGISTNVIYSGVRYALHENIPINYLDDYADINFGIDKTFIINKFSLWTSFKAMNILGNNYEIVRSFPMPGRYYQFTLKFKIE